MILRKAVKSPQFLLSLTTLAKYNLVDSVCADNILDERVWHVNLPGTSSAKKVFKTDEKQYFV